MKDLSKAMGIFIFVIVIMATYFWLMLQFFFMRFDF
jgi:hypothetical protein